MTNWRDTILQRFQCGFARLTLVADPDDLLADEGMLAAIRGRGLDMLAYDDPIAFRYAYESQYRSRWDEGWRGELLVVVQSGGRDLDSLPHDLLVRGRRVNLGLNELFPRMNYQAIRALDRSSLDSLHEAYEDYDGPVMGERQTKDFVLTNCFGVAPRLIKTPADLLKMLLSRHYGNQAVPVELDDYLLEILRREPTFGTWPLDDILPHRDRFLRFLQRNWGSYVDALRDPAVACPVPFGHDDVRVYIDNLFLEGHLTPIEREGIGSLPPWVRTGIRHDPRADNLRRFRGLKARFEDSLPGPEAPHRDWQQAAQTWAELLVLRHELATDLDGDDVAGCDALHRSVEGHFAAWMGGDFASLSNLPYHRQPVMVHHIPKFLALERSRGTLKKVALVILDGMAFDQWLIVRRGLEVGGTGWRFEESGVFAWVPTLTSVSRQAIFAAEPPLFFPDSIDTTNKESALWQRFWQDAGQAREAIGYLNLKGVDATDREVLDEWLSESRLTTLGLVVRAIDDIMHGMRLGTAGMHDQVTLWAIQGHLGAILDRLHARGFTVYLTADHGNVAAKGIGMPNEGVLVETKGKRARVYDRPEFRAETHARFPRTIEWAGPGLPTGRNVLVPEGLAAFTTAGESVVAHGGIALEEVVVPFVKVWREDS